MSCTKSKIQESQRTLSRINVKTNSKLGDTIFKIQKIKDEEKFLKEIWDGGNILLIEKQR